MLLGRLFRRALGYVLAVAVIVGLALLTVGLTDVLWEEPHTTFIALLSALVVVLLFTPVKARIQEALDRLFYKERYSSRKALVRLSEEMNAEMVIGSPTPPFQAKLSMMPTQVNLDGVMLVSMTRSPAV